MWFIVWHTDSPRDSRRCIIAAAANNVDTDTNADAEAADDTDATDEATFDAAAFNFNKFFVADYNSTLMGVVVVVVVVVVAIFTMG